MKREVRIGTRGSKLALWQANYLQAELAKIGLSASINIIKTKGDKIQDLSFDKIEGKGFFTKEIEDALLSEEVDLAVHSMKDLPTTSPEGLVITAVSYREDPTDWLLIRKEVSVTNKLLQLETGAVVGTSSARRKAQLLHFRSDLVLKDIRGNVPTRIDKLRQGQFDAIILAGAGITRLELDLSEFDVIKFDPKEFIPAPAQGVLAFQVRESDKELRRQLRALHKQEVADCTNVERRVLKLLDGGCHLPLGAYCTKDHEGNYHLWAAYAETATAPLKQVRLSSSTRFELAEEAIKSLKG
ncbi:hydroxymethylbilane synthase [Lewinella cohaerens]|uniref:hydroxymethylbilane synthase n=1 Tax=Lewinella cohaerens TaxID=70995 RepID=UPI000477C6B3|nr:hydroxymethylbilane synthase [Lewinella cohaerens]